MKGKSSLERKFIMKTNRNRTLVMAALGLLAAATFVSPAAAQSSTACQGSFTLTNDVRWAGRILPAGDYTFFLKSAAHPAHLELRSPSGVRILVSAAQSRSHENEQSFMTIERRRGSAYVRELYLAPIGVHFFYTVPKIPKEEFLAQGPATTESVLISAVGK
jgi:hypothetical protein